MIPLMVSKENAVKTIAAGTSGSFEDSCFLIVKHILIPFTLKEHCQPA